MDVTKLEKDDEVIHVIEEIVNEREAINKKNQIIQENEFGFTDYAMLAGSIIAGYYVGRWLYSALTSE